MTKARYDKESYLTKVLVNSAALGIIVLLAFVSYYEVLNIIPMKVAITLLGISLITSILGIFCSVESHESVIRELGMSGDARSDVHDNYWTNKAVILYSLSMGLVIIGLNLGLMFIVVNL